MYLLVGLGNPGNEYVFTRHNVGFRVIDELAHRCRVKLKEFKDESLLAQASLAGKEVLLACPQTYMNRSGVAVKALLRRFSLGPERLLVFYDDLDLPLGRLRLRPGGGSGGHHGIESIIAMLQTDQFPRLRLGVGRETGAGDEAVASYLLSPFRREEEPAIQQAVIRAADAVELFLRRGLDAAMNRYNSRTEVD